MFKYPRHSTTNFKALKPFLDATDTAHGHRHFKSEGFMDLVVENLSEPIEITPNIVISTYSISHYYTQYGDLMADPDMVVGVTQDGHVIPMSFQQDNLALYQSVFNPDRTAYSRSLLIDLDEFLFQWLKNIEAQGFYDDIAQNKEPDYEEEEIIF